MYWYNTKYILSILFRRNKESKQEDIHDINGTFLQQLQEIWTITQDADNLRYYYEIYTDLSLFKLKNNSCLAMNVVLNSRNIITQPHNTGRQCPVLVSTVCVHWLFSLCWEIQLLYVLKYKKVYDHKTIIEFKKMSFSQGNICLLNKYRKQSFLKLKYWLLADFDVQKE